MIIEFLNNGLFVAGNKILGFICVGGVFYNEIWFMVMFGIRILYWEW